MRKKSQQIVASKDPLTADLKVYAKISEDDLLNPRDCYNKIFGCVQYETSRCACFTGPRPKSIGWGYDSDKWSRLKKVIEGLVTVLVNPPFNVRRFISGGAQGMDQTAFKAVESARQNRVAVNSNNIYLPYNGYGDQWAVRGLFGQNEFNELLNLADSVRYVSPPGYDSQKLMDRNCAMVQDSDIVIALWDPDKTFKRAKGGTAATLRYATDPKRSKDVVTINPETLVVEFNLYMSY